MSIRMRKSYSANTDRSTNQSVIIKLYKLPSQLIRTNSTRLSRTQKQQIFSKQLTYRKYRPKITKISKILQVDQHINTKQTQYQLKPYQQQMYKLLGLRKQEIKRKNYLQQISKKKYMSNHQYIKQRYLKE